MSRTQLYLPSGQGTIGSLAEFVRDFIPIQVIEHRRTKVAIKTAPPVVAWGDDPFKYEPTVAIQSKDIELNRPIEISRHELMREKTNNALIHWSNARIQASVEDMKALLLNKQESFYRPKLGMEEIQKLSYELLNNNGGDNVYCFHHSVSKYQK